MAPDGKVDSASDDRTVNNTMRHQYRVLSDAEKANMQAIKDEGLKFHSLIEGMGNSRELSAGRPYADPSKFGSKYSDLISCRDSNGLQRPSWRSPPAAPGS